MSAVRNPDPDGPEIELFERVRGLSEPERGKVLAEASSNSAEIVDRVLSRLAREEQMGGFLLTPLVNWTQSDGPFAPHDLAADRFEIVREIAEGGMAIVYEAFDRKLGYAVA